jgi:GNAT superfamily N-acetyltransferase
MQTTADNADLHATPLAAPGLDIRPAGGEVLVHDAATGQIHVLNATAGRVLARCDGATTLAQIVAELVAATGVDANRAARDVIAVCADFRGKGIIR